MASSEFKQREHYWFDTLEWYDQIPPK